MQENIDLRDYGYRDSGTPDIARITAVFKNRYDLITTAGATHGFLSAAYRQGLEDWPTTGDFVRIDPNPTGDSRILETLPRHSLFSRREPGSPPRQQAVAANFDYVFIVTSLNRDFNPNRLERYLSIAYDSGATPVILLTKADLLPDCSAQLAKAENIVPGTPVHALSSLTGQGMDALDQYLKPGVTLALLGSSGVGKSSLVNALAGRELMRVNETRAVDSSKGRHTTTHRQLMRLDCGALIIDTPGMRQLGMWELDEGLSATFGDVEEILARGCRFSDCQHMTEPGCAVRAAIESGELSPVHWRNYLALKREAHFASNYASALREKQARNREIALKNRSLKRKPRR